MFKYLVIVFLTLSVEASIVTIDQGTLNGTYRTTRQGKLFNAFYGIPFAQPPVGELRFKAPKEPKPWTGIFNASAVPNGCLQITIDFTNDTSGVEDCLNLNVYTPSNARKGDNLPVVVYIFGGVYKRFNNMEFGPEYLLEKDVILVEPNFRLGVLGFMTTGDTVIPGNNQLKDQTMALRWVRQNIHHFGGNPQDVTLQGHSSGSMCVYLHTLSPLSKGLFHKVIMQSGVQINGFYGPDVIRGIVKEFATKAGCSDVSTSENMRQCFMTLEATKFPIIEQTMFVWDVHPGAVFKPTIEDDNSEEPFLTRYPSTAEYQMTNIPWMIGLTTGEAAYKVASFLANDGKLAAEVNQNYKLLFPVTLAYLWNTKLNDVDYISRILRLHYFGDREIGAETSHEMTEFYTHGMFGISIMKAIRSYPGPKYVYWYDYKSNYSRQNIIGYYEEFLGVCHGDDIYLLYYTEESDDVLTDKDHAFSEELVKRWVNFVQTGNPNLPIRINEDFMSYWEPMQTDRIEYLRIRSNGTMETDLYKGIFEFWTSLPFGSKYEFNSIR